jgi:hypothetical protein
MQVLCLFIIVIKSLGIRASYGYQKAFYQVVTSCQHIANVIGKPFTMLLHRVYISQSWAPCLLHKPSIGYGRLSLSYTCVYSNNLICLPVVM